MAIDSDIEIVQVKKGLIKWYRKLVGNEHVEKLDSAQRILQEIDVLFTENCFIAGN